MALDASSPDRTASGTAATEATSGGALAAGVDLVARVKGVLSAERPEDRYEIVLEHGPELVEVRDRRFHREVTLRRGTGDQSPQAFLRPARLLGQLDHPAIPKVHDLGTLGGQLFYSLDRIEGRTLPELLAADQRPTRAFLLRALLDLAAAVQHANERGLVHGDIQPDLMILASYGRVWLTGWERAWVLPEAKRSVQQAGEGAEPSYPRAAHRAPEVRAGEAPSESTDVWGLGTILHWMLSGRLPSPKAGVRISGAPRDLRAITRKALHPDPELRYLHAADLGLDLRRFLDGKSVSAERDSMARATLRLARAYPVAAGILLVLLLVLASGTWGTAAYVGSRYRKAQAAGELALQDSSAAEASLEQARERQSQAEQALDHARQRKAFADALQGRRLSEQALAEATTTLSLLESGGRASPGELHSMRTRLLRLRGDYYLRRAEVLRPDLALEAYQELIGLLTPDAGTPDQQPDGDLVEAWFGCYVAARRLPGRDAEEVELANLNLLAGVTGPAGDLARWELEVREAELRARVLVARQPPELLPADEELLEGLRAHIYAYPDSIEGHTLLGRYIDAITAPGFPRSAELLRDGQMVRAASDGISNEAQRSFYLAMQLDPVEPLPAIGYLRHFNDKFGSHSLWRWIGGWSWGRALEASQLTPRLEPMVAVARHLQRLGRDEASLPLLERLLARAPAELRDSEQVALAEAQIMLARARLKVGLEAPQLEAMRDLPADLAAEHLTLLSWQLLVTGRSRQGLELLPQAFQAGIRMGHNIASDLILLLTDDRADPAEVHGWVSSQVPPGPSPQDRNHIVSVFLLVRAVLVARSGGDGTPDLARIEQANERLPWPPDDNGYSLFMEALSRSRFNRNPQEPSSHINLLHAWCYLNSDTGSTEYGALRVQSALVDRLRALQLNQASAQFERVDPVDELFVRRAWVPPEGQAWRVGRRR
jgi:serine/threonine protein kinase